MFQNRAREIYRGSSAHLDLHLMYRKREREAGCFCVPIVLPLILFYFLSCKFKEPHFCSRWVLFCIWSYACMYTL